MIALAIGVGRMMNFMLKDSRKGGSLELRGGNPEWRTLDVVVEKEEPEQQPAGPKQLRCALCPVAPDAARQRAQECPLVDGIKGRGIALEAELGWADEHDLRPRLEKRGLGLECRGRQAAQRRQVVQDVEATAVGRHEIDRIGRRHLRGDDEIAFVLAIFLVDQDDHAAGGEFEANGFEHWRLVVGEADIPEGDGILMGLLLVEIVANSGVSLFELVDDLLRDVGPACYQRNHGKDNQRLASEIACSPTSWSQSAAKRAAGTRSTRPSPVHRKIAQ